MPSTFCFLNQRQACRLASHLAYTCNSTEYRIKCTAEPYFHIYTHFHSDSENANKSNDYEQLHHTRILYITAVPRMVEYEKISAMIYGIYLKYVAPEDVHVYSMGSHTSASVSLPVPLQENCFHPRSFFHCLLAQKISV